MDYEKVQELTRGGATTITTQNGDVRVIVAESPSSPVKPPRKCSYVNVDICEFSLFNYIFPDIEILSYSD